MTSAHLLPAAAHPGRVELRRMRWWDIPGIILLEHAAFPEDAWSVGMFWSELAEASTRYYLVAEEYAPGNAEEPKRAGRGLGAVLLTELMREAARRDCDDVVLEVRVDNERAQRLYRRFGFQDVGIRKGYYQPMGIDALVMRSGAVIERFGGRGAARDRVEADSV